MKSGRILYISPMVMEVDNGMMQRQQQWLEYLSRVAPGRIDFLSLASTPKSARNWLADRNLDIAVLDGPFALAARVNAMAWYLAGIIFCNKLHWLASFRFPVHTPIPRQWIRRYSTILCYYAWNYHLLKLERAGDRVLVDLGDIMADRHERTGARRWISLSKDNERAVVLGAGRCVAISQGDVQEFRRLYGAQLPKVLFVPPNSGALLATPPPDDMRTIGFIGAPSFLNEQILRLLAEDEFLATIKAASIRLLVAGGICQTVDPELLIRLRAGGAKVIGQVQSTLDFYKSTAVVLNPVGPSTGIKIKSVEALMAGRGLVTTRWGSDRSLEGYFPNQIRTIDWPISPKELASISVDFLQHMSFRIESFGAAYRDAAEELMRTHVRA